jgi:hypothetical protein
MASFCMENFEQQELNTATLKPAHWFSHINDTCMVWPYGRDELEKVLLMILVWFGPMAGMN